MNRNHSCSLSLTTAVAGTVGGNDTTIIGLPDLQNKLFERIIVIIKSEYSKWTEFKCKQKISDLRNEIDYYVCFYSAGAEGWTKRGDATHLRRKDWKYQKFKNYLEVNPIVVNDHINIVDSTVESR